MKSRSQPYATDQREIDELTRLNAIKFKGGYIGKYVFPTVLAEVHGLILCATDFKDTKKRRYFIVRDGDYGLIKDGLPTPIASNRIAKAFLAAVTPEMGEIFAALPSDGTVPPYKFQEFALALRSTLLKALSK
jgi:hypothetical protein